MTDKKNRERVIAEITVSYLIRLGNEQGRPLSRQQALAFLNQHGQAHEMWKHMMNAAEEFVAGSLLQHSYNTTDSCVRSRSCVTGIAGACSRPPGQAKKNGARRADREPITCVPNPRQ